MKPKKLKPKKMKPKKLKTNKRAKVGMRKKIDINSVKWKVMVPITMLGRDAFDLQYPLYWSAAWNAPLEPDDL